MRGPDGSRFSGDTPSAKQDGRRVHPNSNQSMVYTVPRWLALQQETALQDHQDVAVAPLLTLRFLFALLRWLDPEPCLSPSANSLRVAWQVCCCPSHLCREVP